MKRLKRYVTAVAAAVICMTAVIYGKEVTAGEAVPLEALKYFEKIEWVEINADSDYMGTLGYASFSFSVPPADNYYKGIDYYHDGIESSIYSKNKIDFNCFPPDNMTEDDPFITFIRNKMKAIDPDKGFENVYKPCERPLYYRGWLQVDAVEIKRIEKRIAGTFGLNKSDQHGTHLLAYNAADATFTADGTFGRHSNYRAAYIRSFIEDNALYDRRDTAYGPYPYYDDKFTLKVLSYGDMDEVILLTSDRYDRLLVPYESLYETAKTDAPYYTYYGLSGKELYEKPSRDSGKRKLEYDAGYNVTGTSGKWEEQKGELGVWYRIKTDDGQDG